MTRPVRDRSRAGRRTGPFAFSPLLRTAGASAQRHSKTAAEGAAASGRRGRQIRLHSSAFVFDMSVFDGSDFIPIVGHGGASLGGHRPCLPSSSDGSISPAGHGRISEAGNHVPRNRSRGLPMRPPESHSEHRTGAGRQVIRWSAPAAAVAAWPRVRLLGFDCGFGGRSWPWLLPFVSRLLPLRCRGGLRLGRGLRSAPFGAPRAPAPTSGARVKTTMRQGQSVRARGPARRHVRQIAAISPVSASAARAEGPPPGPGLVPGPMVQQQTPPGFRHSIRRATRRGHRMPDESGQTKSALPTKADWACGIPLHGVGTAWRFRKFGLIPGPFQHAAYMRSLPRRTPWHSPKPACPSFIRWRARKTCGLLASCAPSWPCARLALCDRCHSRGRRQHESSPSCRLCGCQFARRR